MNNIDIESVARINLTSTADYIINEEFRNYYLGDIGHEHYKLLAYLSTQYNNKILLDIGTYKGCSALAMAHNDKNLVKSFDIRSGLRGITNQPDNVEFIVDNILDPKYLDLVKSSPLILLDTDHEGPFEHAFHSYLQSINWKGLLILDDINYNDPMKEYWNSIQEEKYDITHIGHHSGTGLVIFK